MLHAGDCLPSTPAADEPSSPEGGHVALVAARQGKAAVVLPPVAGAGALRHALEGLQPGGACDLAAALKLALVRTRGRAHPRGANPRARARRLEAILLRSAGRSPPAAYCGRISLA